VYTESIKDRINALRNIVGADQLQDTINRQQGKITQLEEQMRNNKKAFQHQLKIKMTKIQDLQEQVNDLDKIRTTYHENEYSLSEFQTLVKCASEEYQQKMLEKEAKSKANELLPMLVRETVKNYLSSYPYESPPELVAVVNRLQEKETELILKNEKLWPTFFKQVVVKQIKQGISQGIDAEFQKQVEQGAQTKLNQLVQSEWPSYSKRYFDPFFKQNFSEQLAQLSQTLETICPRCNWTQALSLSETGIAELMTTGRTRVQCMNPRCRGWFNSKTTYPITLAGIIVNFNPRIVLQPVRGITLQGGTRRND
jgi:hypothetical protein